MKLKPKKCEFMKSEIKVLGHIVGQEGIIPDPNKVKTILDILRPNSIKDIRGFLGAVGFFRKFISKFRIITKTLYEITLHRYRSCWTDERNEAYEMLLRLLTEAPIL